MIAADGRPYWEVTDASGTRYFFGRSSASRQHHPTDLNLIFKWCLDRVVDLNGNYMTFTYVKDQGEIYLRQIDYTGNGALAPSNTVRFILEARTDAPTLYTTAFSVRTAYRLKAIEIFANGQQVRKYEFQYDYSGLTGRSRVRSVVQYGKDFSSHLPNNS